MNVLNVLYDFWPGGVERLAIDVSNELERQGNNAYLCIISEHYSDNLLQQLDQRVQLIKLVKAAENRKFSYLRQLIRLIDNEKIQVVHVHQGSLMPFYLLVKICRPKVKFYFTSHDTYIFSHLSKLNQLLCHLICDKIIAISDAVVEDIKSCGISKKQIIRVYNGTDFSRFPVNNRKKHDGPAHIVNIARFFPKKKGQDILIEAASLLKENGYNFRISFAGGETNDSRGSIDAMKEVAKKKQLEKQIVFLGNVTDIPQLLSTADIFCIPSRYEGFGISAVEAMGTGLPCVASNVNGLNEVINNPKLGELFITGDSKDLAKKLSKLLDNLDSYNAEFIAENVRRRFSISNMVKKLLSIYRGEIE